MTPEVKQKVEDLEKAVGDARTEQYKAIDAYAAGVPVVNQLVDLALLANGLLKGRNLSDFIARSLELLK